MKVLSLFDGISCARVALERAGIPVEAYYASEIDKYAIQISKKNYPDIQQVGSVTELTNDCGIVRGIPIDLLIGGSPCQDLSIAKKNRKGLDGERSGLFWEYVRILKEVKPKYFILENVASMPKEAKELITKTLGVEPIMINASLLSAQHRKRLFWTNIPNVTLPIDRGILLKDIIHETLGEKIDLEKYIIKGNHLNCITDKTRLQKKYSALNGDKSITMMARQYASWNGQYISVKALTERRTEEAKRLRSEHMKKTGKDFSPRRAKELVERYNDKMNTITTGITKENLVSVRVGKIGKGGQGDRIYSVDGKSVALSALGGGRGAKTGLYLIVPEATKIGFAVAVEGDSVDFSFPTSKTRRGRVGKKAKNIMTSANVGVVGNGYVRKLTPTECGRLQGLPDGYLDGISDSQAYKCAGNAFNVDVVAHVLSFIPRV